MKRLPLYLIFLISTISAVHANPSRVYNPREYRIFGLYGASNFLAHSKVNVAMPFNAYSIAPSFGFGAELYYPFDGLDMGVQVGLSLSSFSAINSFRRVANSSQQKWKERMYSGSLYFGIHSTIIRFLYASLSLSNDINTDASAMQYNSTVNRYSLGATGELYYLISNQISLGVQYHRDITATMKYTDSHTSYTANYAKAHIALKLCYRFIKR